MVLPPSRVTVCITSADSARRTYYRMKQVSSKGALLASKGTFDAGLASGTRISMRMQWRGAQVDIAGVVLHVTQIDPGRAYHAMTVQFDEGDGLEQLLDFCGIGEI